MHRSYLQQQKVFRDPLNRLKQQSVERGFGFITCYIALIEVQGSTVYGVINQRGRLKHVSATNM